MNRFGLLFLFAAAAGCGLTDARLYVGQDGGVVIPGPDAAADAAPSTDADLDGPESDAAEDTTGDAPEPGDATETGDAADVGAPDASELEPACVEIDETMEFGERILGEDHEERIVVRNCGGFESENLVINAVEIVNDDTVTSAPEFSLDRLPSFPFGLLPNEVWPFAVRYAPTEPGEHSAVVRFATNAPDAPTVDVLVTASVR